MDRKLPRGVMTKCSSSGSEMLYLSFTYRGVFCREATGLIATPNNIKYAVRLRGEVINQIKRGNFSFSEFFPESRSKAAKLFGTNLSKVTIGELIDNTKWQDIAPKPSTAYTYQKDAKWAKEALGDIRICDLSIADIRQWIKSMSHLSRKTISNRLLPLRTVLAIAVDDMLISHNPADDVTLGKNGKGLISREQRQKKEVIDPFSNDEIEKILTAAEAYNFVACNYFQLAFYTGMRHSELKGLMWKDDDGIQLVDIENKILRVQSALVSMGGKAHTQTTKTVNGTRIIDLTPKAISALEKQIEITQGKSDYVFTRFDGTDQPLTHNDHYYYPWKDIISAAGVRYRPPKQTRHTYASQMLSGGENPLYICRQMGHADPTMIFKVYGKWINNHQNSHHVFVSDFGQQTDE